MKDSKNTEMINHYLESTQLNTNMTIKTLLIHTIYWQQKVIKEEKNYKNKWK